MENLSGFYQTIGGVAATLLGFLFLAVSNKSKEIVKSSYWNGNAVLAFMVSLIMIVSSLISLTGNYNNMPIVVLVLNIFVVIIQILLLIKGRKEKQKLMFADLVNNVFISLCVVIVLSIPMYFYFKTQQLFFVSTIPYLMITDIAWMVMLSWRIFFMVDNNTQNSENKVSKKKK